MKIAVYHNLPSGGGKRALFEMVKHLSGSHELAVFTTSSAEHDFCDLRKYIKKYQIYPFTPLRLLRSPFGRINAAIRILDLFRLDRLQRRIALDIDQQNYDLVFVHNCHVSQAPGLMQYLNTRTVYYCGEPPRGLIEPQITRPYSRRSKTRRLFDMIDPLPGFYRRTLLHLDQSSTLAATKVLVNSSYTREVFYLVYGRFATTCYLGVDCENYHPLRLQRLPYVISVGALRPHKGFDFLIESLALISHVHRPSLILACNEIDVQEKNFLEDLASRNSVCLEVRIKISDHELIQLYNQALLTLYSPVMEPFGFVPIESMACGTPVIGVNEGGVRETIIDGYNGLLVDRDPAKFSEAIMKLITEKEYAEKLGQQARSCVLDKWTWDRVIKNINDHLLNTASRIY